MPIPQGDITTSEILNTPAPEEPKKEEENKDEE